MGGFGLMKEGDKMEFPTFDELLDRVYYADSE